MPFSDTDAPFIHGGEDTVRLLRAVHLLLPHATPISFITTSFTINLIFWVLAEALYFYTTTRTMISFYGIRQHVPIENYHTFNMLASIASNSLYGNSYSRFVFICSYEWNRVDVNLPYFYPGNLSTPGWVTL